MHRYSVICNYTPIDEYENFCTVLRVLAASPEEAARKVNARYEKQWTYPTDSLVVIKGWSCVVYGENVIR